MKGSLVRNTCGVLSLALLSFLLIRAGQWVGPGWASVGEVVGALLGLLVACLLRARVAAWFGAVMLAVTASEFAVHAVYGMRVVQGAPAHFAVIGSAFIGVVLGVSLASYPRLRGTTGPAKPVAPDPAPTPVNLLSSRTMSY
jgi:hypothetical protein